jgi:proteasome lid subunit RPN8/RPN11
MINIPNRLIKRINKHGEQTYNEECCGALIGNMIEQSFNIKELLEFNNERNENRERRYLISPKQYMQSEKLAADKNLTLLGFYHSHPDHPAIPSQFDTEHALPWFIYIIVSVQKGKAEKLTSWKLKEDRTVFEEIKIMQEKE